MTITVKYDRRDFFGHRIYTEDVKEAVEKPDAEKAFRFLKSNQSVALNIDDDMVLYWDDAQDYNNSVLTVKRSYSWNHCNVSKVAFSQIKRGIMSYFKMLGEKYDNN